MARILGIDYGTKRSGIAVTDPEQIICSPYATIRTEEIWNFLENYLDAESVECIVVGEPFNTDGSVSRIHYLVIGFVRKLRKKFPRIEIELYDERYTSKEAENIVQKSGVGKMRRREKGLVDKISASLILEGFMKEKRGWA